MSHPVYIIGQIAVKDYKTYFSQYALKLKEVLKKYQGEALAGSTKVEVLEGNGYGNWTVLIKFPSRALADECMDSEEYITLSALRKELSTGGNVFLINGNE